MRLSALLLVACAGLSVAQAQDLSYTTSAFWAQTRGVEVVGDHAFCAFQNGLVILDISVPETPALVSRLYCQGNGCGVDVEGDYAYLADELAGLQIIDISDLQHPTMAACYDTDGRAADVVVRDGLAYVADGPGGSGLLILDVSTPTAPQFVGSYGMCGTASRVTIDGNYAYMGGIFEGLEIIDISDPSHPIRGTLYQMCPSGEVFIRDGIAYITASCGGSDSWPDEYSILHVCDVSDPVHPVSLGEQIFYTGWATGPLSVADGLAYVGYYDGAGGNSIVIIDVSDPAQMVQVGSVSTAAGPQDLLLAGDRIFAAVGPGGFQLVDRQIPASPAVIGAWSEAWGPIGLACRDELGFMADGAALRVLDLADPLAPAELARLPLTGSPREVGLCENLAYLVEFNRALNLVDVSDPLSPVRLSRTEDDVRAACIREGYAYIAAGEEGLHIYDLSDPLLPVQTGQCSVPGYAWDVEVAGDFAYLCAFHEGLQVVDISDPENPVLRGSAPTHPDYLMTMARIDTYVYSPTSYNNLLVFDVSDPDHPVQVLTLPMRCTDRHASIHGDLLYVSTFDESGMYGVTILDISDRLAPVVVTSLSIAGSCQALCVCEPYIYLATGGSLTVLAHGASGVGAFDLRPAALDLAITSPVREDATIRFALPSAGRARLDLLDVSGRHRATVFDVVAVPGAHQWPWDWRSSDLASGTYFLRLQADGRGASCRVTLVR